MKGWRSGVGIRKRMMLAISLTLLLVVAAMSWMQVTAQRGIIEKETQRRLALTRRDLIQRAAVLSENVAIQSSNAIATGDTAFIDNLSRSIMEQTVELRYVIVMDHERRAVVHTENGGLIGTVLNDPPDKYAARADDYDTQEYKRRGEPILEFIVPITKAEQAWGVARLGFSLARLNEIIDEAEEEIDDKILTILLSSALVGFGALILSLAGTWFFIFRSLKPLESLEATIGVIEEESDLSQRIAVVSQDEIGKTAAAFNSMLDTFEQIVEQMSSSADHLTQATFTLNKSTDDNALEAQKQSIAMNSMMGGIEAVNNSIGEVAMETDSMASSSQQTKEEAHRGSAVIERGVAAIHELEAYSNQIDHIALIIDEIANKTDILAINTGIEAAKAGEYGKGFTVVAKEVKKLAEQTTNATADIARTIQRIQALTAGAVGAMGDSTETMRRIVERVADVENMAERIAIAMRRQTEVMREMTESVRAMQQVSQGLFEEARKTSDVAGEIDGDATLLKKIVARFITQRSAGQTERLEFPVPPVSIDAQKGSSLVQ